MMTSDCECAHSTSAHENLWPGWGRCQLCTRCSEFRPVGVQKPPAPGGVGVGHDPVARPAHYTGHPSGVEAITITEHMGFCLGNAIKYIWRADLKNDAVEDLKKARWYLDREIARRSGQVATPSTILYRRAGGEAQQD